MKLSHALAGAAALCWTMASAAQGPTDWRQIARQDVRAAYDIFTANHPGVHDPANSGFRAQLARARDEALAIADRARDRTDYEDALGTFSAVLSDGHALVAAIGPGDVALRRTLGDPKVVGRHPHRRNIGRAARPLAVAAMALQRKDRIALGFVPHRAA